MPGKPAALASPWHLASAPLSPPRLPSYVVLLRKTRQGTPAPHGGDCGDCGTGGATQLPFWQEPTLQAVPCGFGLHLPFFPCLPFLHFLHSEHFGLHLPPAATS